MADALTEQLLRDWAFEGNSPELDPKEYAWLGGVAAVTSEATANMLQDYTEEVLALDQDSTGSVVWQSTDLKSFWKDGKINFLRVTDDYIILNVFKPGCHREKEVRINPDFSAQIREYLTNNHFIKWEDISAWWENDANKDTPGGVFAFHREKQVSETHKLVWKGRHTNPLKAGMPFDVEDTLEFEFV